MVVFPAVKYLKLANDHLCDNIKYLIVQNDPTEISGRIREYPEI